jgi:hypothetical protein
MAQFNVIWSGLKRLKQKVGADGLVGFIDQTSRYMIFLLYQGSDFTAYVPKTTPRNADQIDFEDNFKAAAVDLGV